MSTSPTRHPHLDLKGKKATLYIVHLIIFCISIEDSICWKLLSCGIFFKYYSKCFVHRAFKCNKIAVHFKSTLDVLFMVLYKYINCAADKTIDGSHTVRTDCN